MIDLGLVRKDPERYKKLRRGADLDAALSVDAQYKDLLKRVEDMRAKRNASSQEIGKAKAAKDEAKAQALMSEVSELKARMAEAEAELTALTEKQRGLILTLPNLPHESVPVGASEADNPVVRAGLPPKTYDFKPLDHQTVGEKLGILDLAAAAKLSGSRFALWRGAGARLLRSIINFQLDLHTKEHGYVETAPPYLVRPEIMEGTGQLPKFEQDLYKTTQEDALLYLIPTSEVPLTNLVRDTIVDAAALPMKLTAYTPCFRQEAGSYGKDVRGVIRNHQFDKVELVWITKPEDSLQALEDLVKHAEKVLTTLELPHRVIHLCTGDMGFSSRKTYDLEVFLPSENRYREISSCSDCGDFQARRMQARFRREAKAAPELVHTLNGSGVAVGRLAAAILENGQQKDGSVLIPKALQPYFGADKITA